MRGIAWLVDKLAHFQDGICSMALDIGWCPLGYEAMLFQKRH